MIKSVSYSQEEIIKDIISLHLEGKDIECDPTYSKGNFYKKINKPKFKFDLVPQSADVMFADCTTLPLPDSNIQSVMFDPPFVISKGPSLQQEVKGSNIISNRFSSFESPKQLWNFYEDSLREFYRVLKDKGVLIFKCQDTVSGGKNYLSHIFIINKAVEIGFYPKDLFILGAKNRLNSSKIKKQQHARKHHSYFLVFIKEKSKVDYGIKQNLSGFRTGLGSLGHPGIFSGFGSDIPTLRQLEDVPGIHLQREANNTGTVEGD